MVTREEVEDLGWQAAHRRLPRAEVAHRLLDAAGDAPHALPAPQAHDATYWEDYELLPMTRAELLVAAGEHFELAEEGARAVECYRAAVADGGRVAPDARACLAGALMTSPAGAAEADELLGDLFAAGSADPVLHQYVGELLEVHREDLEGAARWFTAGLLRSGADPDEMDPEHLGLATARERVRRAQGLAPDGWDEIAVQARARLRRP